MSSPFNTNTFLLFFFAPFIAVLSPSAVAWTSSSASYAAPTVVAKPPSSSVMLPRPSGSIIPPSTTSNTVGANSGSTVMASKVLFSVTLAAVLRNLF